MRDKQNPTLLLVHGAWHASWCWARLTSELDKQNILWQAIDLPGHHPNDRRFGWFINMNTYAEAVAKAIQESRAPVLLVGHSMGGMVVSAAAELAPEKLVGLVYISAYLPQHKENMNALSTTDKESLIMTLLKFKPLRGGTTLKLPQANEVIYNGCSEADIAFADERLGFQPLPPVFTKLTLTPDRFGSVRRFYIHSTQDRAVSFSLQKRMVERSPCEKVYSIDSGHSPFFSHPQTVANYLQEIVSLT